MALKLVSNTFFSMFMGHGQIIRIWFGNIGDKPKGYEGHKNILAVAFLNF